MTSVIKPKAFDLETSDNDRRFEEFDECLAILKNANRPLSARRLSKMMESSKSTTPQAIEAFLRGLEHVDELRKGILRCGTTMFHLPSMRLRLIPKRQIR